MHRAICKVNNCYAKQRTRTELALHLVILAFLTLKVSEVPANPAEIKYYP